MKNKKKIEKICIDCGRSSVIYEANYNSAYCKVCGLKKENKAHRWGRVQKYIDESYRRGCIDTRKEFRHFLISMLMTKFPQYKFLKGRRDEKA